MKCTVNEISCMVCTNWAGVSESHPYLDVSILYIFIYICLPLDTLGVSDPLKSPNIVPLSTHVAFPDPCQCLGVRREILQPPVPGTGECLSSGAAGMNPLSRLSSVI